MSKLTDDQKKAIENCVKRIAKKHTVTGICLYGSRAAGYASPNSDFDILIALEDYAYKVKYVYRKEMGIKISALVVDTSSLKRDATSGYLGEFVVGRLLHVYEPILNPDFFFRVEIEYKRRIVLEEAFEIVRSANILSTEISFPLEFIVFSKIKRRSALYPNAVYSYFKTYSGDKGLQNKQFTLAGFQEAFKHIVKEDSDLFVLDEPKGLVRLSERSILVEGKGKIASLKLTKKLHEFSSYFVHTYAGRKTFHHAVLEAESKIRRHVKYEVSLPEFMSCPKNYYWRLPEGIFIFGEKDWLDSVANSVGLNNCFVLTKRRMGGANSSTVLYTLANQDRFKDTRKIVVKEISKSKAVKYAALGLWESKLKFNDTIFRLGNEYKALRYIRRFGLHSPSIIGLILNKRTIITDYVQGKRLSDVIQAYLEGKDNDNYNKNDSLSWIRLAAKHIAQIHSDKSTFGNLRPKNLILSGEHIFFTNLERFGFKKGDPVRDIAQFISWSLAKTRNVVMARNVIMAFLDSYSHKQTFDNLIQYANSNRYLEVHYPLLSRDIAMTIKQEMRNFVR